MKLSVRANYILLPVILVIFSLGGLLTYQVERDLILQTVRNRLELESKLVIEAIEHEYMEIDSLTQTLLNNVEVSRYLNEPDRVFASYTLGHQILQYVKGILASSGHKVNFALLDDQGEYIYYYDEQDPFAVPQHTPSLQQYLDLVSHLVEEHEHGNQTIFSYKLDQLSDSLYSINIYRTFSPEHSIYRKSLQKEDKLFTIRLFTRFDIEERFGKSIKQAFDPNTKVILHPKNAVSHVLEKVEFEPVTAYGVKAIHPLSDVEIVLSESYISSLLHNFIISIMFMVAIISLITFLLLKMLISKQILEPVEELTRKVKKAIEGDDSSLHLVDKNDEISQLNNNYINLLADISKLAKRDTLTGLANRSVFANTLRRGVEKAYKNSEMCALFYMDLDNFKSVNDNYGHHVGDQLLIEFSNKLNDCFRASDIVTKPKEHQDVARLAGDEFAVLLSDVPDIDAIVRVAERVVAICEGGLLVSGVIHDVKISVGIAVAPNDTKDPQQLVKYADAAMYQVKRSGKNDFRFYSKELEEELSRLAYIESALKRSYQESLFYLQFMPIFDCHSGEIVGAEALLRSECEKLSSVGAEEFIPIAESIGLIREIDMWVIESAVQSLKQLRDEKGFTGMMAINFSSLELKNPSFVGKVEAIIHRYKVPPEQIEMEITETCLVSSDDDTVETLAKLKALGVHLSLDDFGTGYTAFNQLNRYPVDSLKVDRTFVEQIGIKLDDGKPLVDIIVELAALYDLTVVAEGVQTRSQLQYVHQLGCQRAQGALLSSPIVLSELMTLLSEYHADTLLQHLVPNSQPLEEA